MTLNIALRVSLSSGIIFTKFDLRQLIRPESWFIAFYADTLCHAVTLTFDTLTLKARGTLSVTWSKSVRNVSEIEQFPAELSTILRLCDLDLWPLDLELLQQFGCHVFKRSPNLERNRIIHGWVIDDLARFRRAIWGVGHFYRTILSGAWTQLHQFRQEHRSIIAELKICFRVRNFGYLAAFSNACGSKLSDVENDGKVRTFRPLWKLLEGWRRSLDQLMKHYVQVFTTEPTEYTWWLSAVYWKIKKRKEKKSSSVKLKAFQWTMNYASDSWTKDELLSLIRLGTTLGHVADVVDVVFVQTIWLLQPRRVIKSNYYRYNYRRLSLSHFSSAKYSFPPQHMTSSFATPPCSMIRMRVHMRYRYARVDAHGQHWSKIMKPPQSLPLQMAERLLELS